MSLAENFKKAHLERKSGRTRLAASALLAAVAFGASGCCCEGEVAMSSPAAKYIAKDLGPPHDVIEPIQHGGGGGGGGGGTT